MSPTLFSFISACTALIATIVGPYVSVRTAKSQINANVISANRAKWIETMRDQVASVISQIKVYMMLRAHLHHQGNTDLGANPELLMSIEKGLNTVTTIRLMINPSEPDNQMLVQTLDLTLACLRSGEDQAHMEGQIAAYSEEIIRLSQAILKREWVRVKQGT